jgi:hypothetical protein
METVAGMLVVGLLLTMKRVKLPEASFAAYERTVAAELLHETMLVPNLPDSMG